MHNNMQDTFPRQSIELCRVLAKYTRFGGAIRVPICYNEYNLECTISPMQFEPTFTLNGNPIF